MENKTPMLSQILDDYESGELEIGSDVHKCYLCDEHKEKNIVTWVHDHELRGYCALRKIGKQAMWDILVHRGK